MRDQARENSKEEDRERSDEQTQQHSSKESANEYQERLWGNRLVVNRIDRRNSIIHGESAREEQRRVSEQEGLEESLDPAVEVALCSSMQQEKAIRGTNTAEEGDE
jgi:hypothetical protein